MILAAMRLRAACEQEQPSGQQGGAGQRSHPVSTSVDAPCSNSAKAKISPSRAPTEPQKPLGPPCALRRLEAR